MANTSVIIPAYNAQDYIARCLDSVCQQTQADIQILVVDDGSKDRTAEIVKGYAAKDSRIRLCSQENCGLVMARKKGIEEAGTECVMFIDADDWIAEDMVSAMEAEKRKTQAELVVSGLCYAFDSHVEPHSIPYGVYEGMEFFELLLEEKVPHQVAAVLYQKSLFQEFPWDLCKALSMGEDLAISILLSSRGVRAVTLDRDLYYYYQNPRSMSHFRYEKIVKIYDALDTIKNYLRQRQMLAKYRQQMDFLYYLHGVHYHGIMPFQRNYRLRRELKKRWQQQGINIYQNPCYQEFAKRQPLEKKIFMKAYRYSFHFNYILGAAVMPVFNWIKKR